MEYGSGDHPPFYGFRSAFNSRRSGSWARAVLLGTNRDRRRAHRRRTGRTSSHGLLDRDDPGGCERFVERNARQAFYAQARTCCLLRTEAEIMVQIFSTKEELAAAA